MSLGLVIRNFHRNTRNVELHCRLKKKTLANTSKFPTSNSGLVWFFLYYLVLSLTAYFLIGCGAAGV